MRIQQTSFRPTPNVGGEGNRNDGDDTGSMHLRDEEVQPTLLATPVQAALIKVQTKEEQQHVIHTAQLHRTLKRSKEQHDGQYAEMVLPKLRIGQIDAKQTTQTLRVDEVAPVRVEAGRPSLRAAMADAPLGTSNIILWSAAGDREQQKGLSMRTAVSNNDTTQAMIQDSLHDKETHKQSAESQARTSRRLLASLSTFHAQAHSSSPSSVFDVYAHGASTGTWPQDAASQRGIFEQKPPPVNFGRNTRGTKAMLLSHVHTGKVQQYEQVPQAHAHAVQNSKHARRLLGDGMDGDQTNEEMQQEQGQGGQDPASLQPNRQMIEYWKQEVVDRERERERDEDRQAEQQLQEEARADATFPVIGGALMFIGLFLLCGACAASKGQVCVCVCACLYILIHARTCGACAVSTGQLCLCCV